MVQMKNRGLSIRYKILLLLTLLPLITLAVYLVMAVKVFEDDKVAYVFETSSSSARTLSSQATTDLNSILGAAKPIIQEFISSRNFGAVSKAIFQSDPSLEWVAAFEKKPDGVFSQAGISERLSGIGLRDLQSFGDVTSLLNEATTKGRILRVPFKDDRVLVVERVGAEQDADVKVFLMLGRVQELASSFRAPTGFESFLVNESGFVLFGPSGSEATYLSQKFSLDFLTKAVSEGRVAGTQEVYSGGQPLLASFAKTAFNDATVVSVVEKRQALRAVDILIRRSLLFFGVLISFSVIVSLLASGRLTATLTDLFTATNKVAEGQFDIRVNVKSNDEVGSLATSFNAMAAEVSRLMMETAEKARMESELKTAQTVQETLFPPAEAKMGGLQINGYYEPASECGGDWWHYSQIENKVYLWIGDATGHGAPAALITSAAKSAATIIERLNVDPAHALGLMNRAIFDVSKGRIMMTFFLASFDIETKQLTYTNASHEAPYLMKYKEDGDLKKKDLIPLNEVNSPRLGQARDTVYEQTTVTLDLKDRLLFYTDGIPDIENQSKESWGEREFIKAILSSNKGYPPVASSVKQMVDQFSTYRNSAPLKDDITFFMAEYTGS